MNHEYRGKGNCNVKIIYVQDDCTAVCVYIYLPFQSLYANKLI